MSKYNVGLKTLLLQGLSEHEFYGDLVYKFRKIIGKNDFPYHFKKIVVRYKKIGYNVMRHNWWVSFAPESQYCYFCEPSCLFYLSFNFDLYVSKIMHLWVRNLPHKPNN